MNILLCILEMVFYVFLIIALITGVVWMIYLTKVIIKWIFINHENSP